MAKLLVQESNGAREFELVDLEVNIGRELDNTLRLSDPSISRHHAVLRRTASGYEIKDLGSSNGVLLNGVKVDVGNLKDGDRITLGQMQLTFVDPPAEDAASPLGTVRMNLEDMAKIQAGASGGPAVPPPAPPAPAAPPQEPPAQAAPSAPPLPPPSPRTEAPRPAPGAAQPPAFLQPYLPPVPDDARPLMAGGGIERGDFGTRLVAVLIDGAVGMILYIVFWLAVVILGVLTHGLGIFLGCLIYLLVGLGYTVFMLWCLVAFRATLGKKIMKLRVVPEANPQGNITWSQALLRFLGHWVSGMLACLPYLLILGSERKGFQDLFSGSIAIKVDR